MIENLNFDQFVPEIESHIICDQRLRDWLCERIEIGAGAFHGASLVPRWWRICWLVARNDGWQVHGWGYISSGGLFGYGLEQDDALDLMQTSAFLNGVQMFSPSDPFDVLLPVFQKFLEVHKELQAKQDCGSQ